MLAKIKRQYKDPVSDNPYVGFKVWVSVGQSNTPVTLYGDRLGNTVIGQGVINTDQDGKVEFYVDDNNEYTLRLVHPVSGYVMSKEQGVDPKSDSVKTDELTPDEISQVRALVQTGGTTGQAFIQFKEEGTNLGTLGTVTAVNFVGDGVVATRTGNEVTITIDGGIDEVPPAADIALIDSGSYFASDNVEDALQQVGGALQTVNTTLEALGTAAQADTSDFAPASHDHAIANITGLQTALDSKQADIQFQDSGVNVGTAGAVSTINFTGDATLSLNGAELTINVTGGGGGGSNEAGDITITDTADYYTSSNVEGALQEVGQKLSNIDSTLSGLGSAAQAETTDFAAASHVGAGGTSHAVVVSGGAAGFMTGTDKQKLDGIAEGATANSADSILLNRANHTGTQAISTVSGLQTALDAKAPSTLTVEDVAGTSYTLVAADNGKIKRFTSGSAVSVTVPTGLGSGFSCTLVQGGAGAVTVAAGASATLNSMSGDLTTSGQHATISIIPVATNSYLAVGAVGDFVTAVYNAMKSIVVDGSNITTTDNDGAKTMTFAASGGGGGGSGDVVGPASSVDSEIALYDGTTGKLLKRASGNGLAVLTNGVLSTVTNTLTTLPINEQTASYTLVIGDAGRQVDMNSASANNLTIPPNSSVAFPVDTVIAVCQMGAGATTIVAGPGVTIQKPASRTLVLAEQYEVVYLHKKATDTWRVIGGLGAA